MDLLTTCNSRFGTTNNYSATAISTIHRSPQHPLSLLQLASTDHFLTTNFNNGDSSASVMTPLPAGEHSTTELRHLFLASLAELNYGLWLMAL
jgi:hypothetical protein